MENKIWNALEGILFALILTGIYWVIGFFCKFIFGFEIRNQIGYTICIVGGFLLRHLLIAIFSGNV